MDASTPEPSPSMLTASQIGSHNSSKLDTTFKELFEFVPVVYHEIDATGVLRRVNQTECGMLGYAAPKWSATQSGGMWPPISKTSALGH